ncbi:hypothetical protein ACHAWO_012821 [Cyclotella atomus]|uniref:RING-type domain-containing protein n=1 Tax=Cyclotella atomus TaxID=382360 RepID=A0ABD3P8L4_9STRA
MSASPRRTRSTTRNNDPQPSSLRRSTRNAALDANIRVVDYQNHRARRPKRLQTPPTNNIGGKDHPIELLDDSDSPPMANLKTDESLSDFTCPICLDCPPSLQQLATISGCTHRFCFECIDTWASTENRCPCCKARFRTIDRVEPLEEVKPRKRKRSDNDNKSRSPRRRLTSTVVNSRTVQDRNQPSGPVMNVAFIEQILEQFANISNNHGGNVMTGIFANSGGGGPSFRFSNVNNNPVMRIERPGGSGGGNGYMELFLAEREGEGGRPGRGRVRIAREGDVFPPLPIGVARAGGGVANLEEVGRDDDARTGVRRSPRRSGGDTSVASQSRAEANSRFFRQQLRARETEAAAADGWLTVRRSSRRSSPRRSGGENISAAEAAQPPSEALAESRLATSRALEAVRQQRRNLAEVAAFPPSMLQRPARSRSSSTSADSLASLSHVGARARAAAGGNPARDAIANQAETTRRSTFRFGTAAASTRDQQRATRSRRSSASADSLASPSPVGARARAAAGGTHARDAIANQAESTRRNTVRFGRPNPERSTFGYGTGTAGMRPASVPAGFTSTTPGTMSGVTVTLRFMNHPEQGYQGLYNAAGLANPLAPNPHAAASAAGNRTIDGYERVPVPVHYLQSRPSAGNLHAPAPARGARSRASNPRNNAASSPPRRSRRLASSAQNSSSQSSGRL